MGKSDLFHNPLPSFLSIVDRFLQYIFFNYEHLMRIMINLILIFECNSLITNFDNLQV